MNIYTAIKKGSKILKKKNIKSSDLDCEILLAKAIKKQRKYLILNLDKQVNNENLQNYEYLINQRSTGKPIAFLTKKKNFWKSEFIIEEGVLIPRPDTEVLIDETLKIFKNIDASACRAILPVSKVSLSWPQVIDFFIAFNIVFLLHISA